MILSFLFSSSSFLSTTSSPSVGYAVMYPARELGLGYLIPTIPIEEDLEIGICLGSAGILLRVLCFAHIFSCLSGIMTL